MMSNLSRHIAELSRLVAATAGALDLASIRIVEVSASDFDASGRPLVDDEALQSVEAYAERFDVLLASGYAWLNLSYLGRLRDWQLVAVELPAQRAERATATAVNYSGVSHAVRADGGNVDAWIARRPRAGGST